MEEKEWVRCDRCDGEIYEGAEYYQINGECHLETSFCSSRHCSSVSKSKSSLGSIKR